MRNLLIIPVLVFTGILSSCTDYEADVKRLGGFARLGQVGSSPDFWMEKFNLAGEWEKTMLVFGYADDRQACLDLVSAWAAKYPLDTYRCSPAN
jgi:hypothetical protein